jgi:NitT/TauT family transport system permease protein
MLTALYTIPKVTLYPMVLLVFGLGISAKVAFGVMHGIIPVIIFTMDAVLNINPVLLKTARVLKLSPAQTAARILIPAVTPEIVTGLRLGFSLTLLGVIIGEMFASQQGLGFLIINGMNVHDVRMLTAAVLLLVLFAVASSSVLLALDRRLNAARRATDATVGLQ